MDEILERAHTVTVIVTKNFVRGLALWSNETAFADFFVNTVAVQNTSIKILAFMSIMKGEELA